eukprot:8301-Amphidinium_carterae.2
MTGSYGDSNKHLVVCAQDLILKLMLSSAAEFFFSLILIVAHVLNNGLLHHIFFHALAITLPGEALRQTLS